ncbi:MAG: T9SS type A sorting domain-containing protein [Chitinophagales bacterium]|nr:T9SS type A sorting domain-containing protein [Chitinophagales bacterium]
MKIFNKNYELMENGDSINDGYFVNVYADIMRLMGYVSMQGAIIIKKPNSTSTYYLLHSYIGFSQELNIGTYGAKLLATEIDMSANNGLGKVISKNKTIIDDTIGTSVSACRHANGEDWWIVVQEQNSNCFYKVLIDKNGISPNIKKDCEGPPSSILVHYSSSSCFSPNGKTYTYLSRSDGLYIFDFDRCTGKLSNRRNIRIPEIQDSLFLGYGVSVSPNSRFLYLTSTFYIHQYDLTALDILSSKTQIAHFDNYKDTLNWIPYAFFQSMQLAPDNRIYIGTGNATYFCHVISLPDKKGDSCYFVQRGLKLPTISCGVPNFPYFRLGKAESICGVGLEHLNNDKVEIVIYPNPSSDQFTIDFKDLFEGKLHIMITNMQGAVIKNVFAEKELVLIKIQDWQTGIYAVNIYNQYGVNLLKKEIHIIH